jgi:uncharacterized membrane protein YjgN (DUF898 family)
MEKSTKIIVTIVVVIVWMIINGLMYQAKVPVVLKNAFAFVVIAGLIAVWKSGKKNNDDKKGDNDSSILQK